MTIAAGFCCSDGLVMCADSQCSIGDHKVPVEKLVIRSTSSTQVMIVGAGHYELVKMAVDRTHEYLEECPDLRKAARGIGNVLKDLYSEEFKEYPSCDRDDVHIDLLIGYKYGNRQPVLFKISATAVSKVHGYALIGSGQVVQPWIHDRYSSSMTVSKGLLFANQVLGMAKSMLRSVGGCGQIAALHHNNKEIHEEAAWRIADVEWALRRLETQIAVFSLDVVDADLSDEEFRMRINDFNADAIKTRHRFKQKIADSAALADEMAAKNAKWNAFAAAKQDCQEQSTVGTEADVECEF